MHPWDKATQWQLDIGRREYFEPQWILKHFGYCLEEIIEGLDAAKVFVPEAVRNLRDDLKGGTIKPDGITNKQQVIDCIDAFTDCAVFSNAGIMCCGFNPTDALSRVVKSNDSKRINGLMKFDAHGKIIKGENYSPPDWYDAWLSMKTKGLLDG